MLVVFSDLPGAGKSALAEAAGRVLGIPVFAKDWLEANALFCGLTGGKQKILPLYLLI